MGNTLLKLGLYGLGIAGILIGGGIAIFGSHIVANFFNSLISVFHDAGPVTDISNPNVESEFRFFSVMFVFYGAVLVQTARDLDRYASRVPVLLAVFFLAGVARIISHVMIGTPHPLFVGLMAIELGLPILLLMCWEFRKPTT